MDITKLIKEARHGSTAAQKYLFDQLSDKMLLLCRRYVKNREDAEEILLDGFYKFFKTLPAFNYHGEPALNAWLKKIMVNECLMYLRKENSFVLIAETEAEELPVHQDMLDALQAEEICKMIVQLPVGYRTVFNLYAIEGLSHKEIATQLGISEGTSKSQLSKAKQLLQKMLIKKNEWYERQQKNG